MCFRWVGMGDGYVLIVVRQGDSLKHKLSRFPFANDVPQETTPSGNLYTLLEGILIKFYD